MTIMLLLCLGKNHAMYNIWRREKQKETVSQKWKLSFFKRLINFIEFYICMLLGKNHAFFPNNVFSEGKTLKKLQIENDVFYFKSPQSFLKMWIVSYNLRKMSNFIQTLVVFNVSNNCIQNISIAHFYRKSYEDFRSKTNAVILLDMGHTLKGEHIQEE
jgi:hypothetical protein